MRSRVDGNPSTGPAARRPPSFPRKRESTSINFIVQVSPCWIAFLDQLDLPRSIPLLDRLFSLDGAFHTFMNFVPNQSMNTVTFRESFYKVIPVLPSPLNEIRRDTDIQGAVWFARKDVNTGDFHENSWIPAFAGMTPLFKGMTGPSGGKARPSLMEQSG